MTSSGLGTLTTSIRPATSADIPAIRRLLCAYQNDDPPETRVGPDIVGPYVAHILAEHVAMVAAAGVDDADVVAYGAVAAAGRGSHLADLFVREDLRGQGIGTRLLNALLAGRTLRTTFASSDPRAMPAYVKAGMLPRWPLLYLEGLPEAVAQLDAGWHVVRGATNQEVCALEADWTGANRPADHAFWASQAAADVFVVLDGSGSAVAAGYGRGRQASCSSRALDRLVIAPGVDPVPPVAAAIRRVMQAGSVAITVPGPHPALPSLLRAGFTIADSDVYMAGPSDPVDPARLLPNNGML